MSEVPPATSIVPPQIVKPTPATSTAVPVASAPPASAGSIATPLISKTTPTSSISTTVPVAVNAPPASTGSAAAIVHPFAPVSAGVSSPPVSTVSLPDNVQPASTASLVVNAPPATAVIVGDAPPTSVAADATVSDEAKQPLREDWFRYTCAEVAVDKGAAETMRSTPDQLGLNVQRAVITKSSNLWDNGVVSSRFIVFTSTNNSFSCRPSLTAS